MAMLQAGTITRRQAELAEKIRDARGTRDMQGPQGTRAGGQYVAANPLEHLGTALRKGKAGRDIRKHEETLGELDAEYEGGMADALRAYSRRMDVAGRGGTIQPEGASTFPMGGEAPLGGGGEFVGSQPQPSLPQPPPLDVPPMAAPQMQQGNVTVGDIPGNPMNPQEMGRMREWLATQSPQSPKPPTAMQKYAEQLRKLGLPPSGGGMY